MGSCRLDSRYGFLGAQCSLNSSSAFCDEWEYGLGRYREVRMWTRAKDLLYGYALIWLFLCLPRLYFYLKKLSFKRFIFTFSSDRLRRGTDLVPPLPPTIIKHYRDSGCPVCLASAEELGSRLPVTGSCGHALCAECFVAMWRHGKAIFYPVLCPLCMASFQKVVPVASSSVESEMRDISSLNEQIRRYNLIFSGHCAGILPASQRSVATLCKDAISRFLRIGYFFMLFDRKMLNTISFFVLHIVIAVVVEYFENTYLQSFLDHI